jgi:predicted protein tyrosine phosphatase
MTASKISTLTQGVSVGVVSDNFDERIEQKIFHAEIVVDNEKVAEETKTYQKIPEILSFVDAEGEDMMKYEIEANYQHIKLDIVQVIETELERIKNEPDLQHFVQKR